MIGKVPPDLLGELVLGRTGAADDRVLQGPAYGEDTAAIDLGDETLVVNTDPISLAADRVGTLGVHVACNDVAASGGTPEWLTSAMFLPDDAEDVVDRVTDQLHRAARDLDVAIVGGHSEFAPDRAHPLLVLTCFGLADRFVPTGGAEPGDDLVLTKGAGIEGTAILATDFADLVSGTVPPETVKDAAGFFDRLSVVPEAAALRAYATAMHDPTEGGLVDGLLELAVASEVALDVDRDAVPVAEETRALCAAAGVDPFRIFGSGALVAAVPPAETDAALSAVRDRGIEAAVVGTVRESDEPELVLGGETYREPVRDDMYDLWA